jgi:hypothetical protein
MGYRPKKPVFSINSQLLLPAQRHGNGTWPGFPSRGNDDGLIGDSISNDTTTGVLHPRPAVFLQDIAKYLTIVRVGGKP